MASTSASGFASQNAKNEEFLDLIRQNKPPNDIKKSLKGVNINYENDIGDTALRLAVANANKEIIKLLRENGVDINLQNRNRETALHLAVGREDKNVVELLLDHFALVDIPNTIGKTAINVIDEKLKTNPNDDNLKAIAVLLNNFETYYADGMQLHGNLYQVELIMLIYMRLMTKDGTNNTFGVADTFRLSSDWNVAGKFDDVVVEREFKDPITGSMQKMFHFYQAKHKLKAEEKITIGELLSNAKSPSASTFAIPKYFKSYIGVTNYAKFEKCKLEFCLVTNTHFQDSFFNGKDINFIQEEDFTNDQILYFKTNNFYAKKYKLCDNSKLKEKIKSKLIEFALNSKRIEKFPNIKKAISASKSDQSKFLKEKKALIEKITELKSKRTEVSKYLESDLQKIQTDADLRDMLKKTTNDSISKDSVLHSALKKSLDRDLGEVILELLIIEALIDDAKLNEYLQGFLNEFRIVTNFPDENDLGNLIKETFCVDFNLSNVNLVYASSYAKILNYLRDIRENPRFLTNQTRLSFYIDVKNQMNTIQISGITKYFVAHLRDDRLCFPKDSLGLNELQKFLSDQNDGNQVFYLFTEAPTTTANKLLQIFEKHPIYSKNDSFIFENSETLSLDRVRADVLNAFESDGCHNLLIISVNDGNLDDELCKKIQQKLEKSKDKVEEEMRMKLKRKIGKVKNVVGEKEIKIKKILLIKNGAAADQDESKNLEFNLDKFKYHHEEDTNICFKHLDNESQSALLQHEVNFQLNEIHPKKNSNKSKLNALIDVNCAKEIFTQASHLARLLDKRELCIGDANVFEFHAYVEDYYISREFHRQKVSPKALEMTDQLFFITGATRENLNAFKVSDDRILQWKEIEMGKGFENGIILNHLGQNNAQIFEKIEGNVQWLRYVETKQIFHWVGCKGRINEKFIEQIDKDYNPNDHSELFNETCFCNGKGSAQKVVLIANDAGMGKSLMLINLARLMKGLTNNKEDKKNVEKDQKWIIRINLNEFARDKSPNLNEVKNENAIDFFVRQMAIPGDENNVDIDMQRQLLKYCLTNKSGSAFKMPKIIVMLDGFDETCPDYRDATTRLIKALKDSEVAQIYVTTRVHEKNHLEQELESPAFNLKSWNEKYQEEFLLKFWKWSLKYESDPINRQIKAKNFKEIREYLMAVKDSQAECYKDELIESISVTLDTFSEEMSDDVVKMREAIANELKFTKYIEAFHMRWQYSINDRANQFVSIPLLLRMLSEITIYYNFAMPTDQGLSSLYDKFIKMKFQIWSREKAENIQGKPSVNASDKSYHKEMVRVHCALAVRLFFPGRTDLPKLDCLDDLDDDEANPECTKEERERLACLGLLTLNGNELQFIHRSFAEYFVSGYLIDELRSDRVQVFLFDKILPNEEYRLIHKFVDDQMKVKLQNDRFGKGLKSEAKWVFVKKWVEIFKEISRHNLCSICTFIFQGIRHDKQLHRNLMTKGIGTHVPYQSILDLVIQMDNGCEIFDLILNESLWLDDETIKKECFKLGIGSNIMLLNVPHSRIFDMINRLIEFVKTNKSRLGDEFLMKLLKNGFDDWNILRKTLGTEQPLTSDDISIIDKILEHYKPYPSVRREMMLQVNQGGQNVLSIVANKVVRNKEHYFSIDKVKEIIEKLTENIDESDDKYFEDLAIISAARASLGELKQLLDIIDSSSKLYKKINDIVEDDIEATRNALILAINNCRHRKVKIILNRCESMQIKKRVLLNDGGNTALRLAVKASSYRKEMISEILNCLQNEQEFLKQLLLLQEGWHTVLYIAAMDGYTDIVQLLLEKSPKDTDFLEEFLQRKPYYFQSLTSIEWAYENKDFKTVAIILKFVIDNCIDVMEDLVKEIGGIQTALECLKCYGFNTHFEQLLKSKTLYKQIHNLFKAIKGSGTDVGGLLKKINDDYDTIELLMSKDLDGNSFLALCIQKDNQVALGIICDFLKKYFYLYDLQLKAFQAQTVDKQNDVLTWAKTNLGKDFSLGQDEKICEHIAFKQLTIALRRQRLDIFVGTLKWTKENYFKEKGSFVYFLHKIIHFLADFAGDWLNSNVPKFWMDIGLKIIEGPQMSDEYNEYEPISDAMANYDPNEEKFRIADRLKSKFFAICDFVLKSENAISLINTVWNRVPFENIQQAMSQMYPHVSSTVSSAGPIIEMSDDLLD